MQPELSIIIVNYNVKELLFKCLESIYKTNLKAFEVLVVDNNSSDDSCQMVKKNFPEAILIENKLNAGFPKANNQAIALAASENIFLLNPDTVIIEDALSKILELLVANPGIKIIAPCLLNPDLSVQFSIQKFITVKEVLLEVFFLHKLLKKKESYYNNTITEFLLVEAASGAALLIRKEVFEKIGMLDEKMFWTEDMEFCYRANMHGIKTWYIPQIRIIHYVGQSGKKNQKVMVSNQVLTKINFFRKNHSKAELAIVYAARVLHIISRIIIFGFLSPLGKVYREKFVAYLFTLKRLVTNAY